MTNTPRVSHLWSVIQQTLEKITKLTFLPLLKKLSGLKVGCDKHINDPVPLSISHNSNYNKCVILFSPVRAVGGAYL